MDFYLVETLKRGAESITNMLKKAMGEEMFSN